MYNRSAVIDADVQHIFGPHTPPDRGVIVTCIVRDSEAHIRSFIEHHQALGVSHIILLDNGSIDKTVEKASVYQNVTILRSTLSYKEHHLELRRWLVRTWCSGQWCLHVDIDERFLYPRSEDIGLETFVRYLESRGYSAVIAHQLDMFGEGPLVDVPEYAPMEQCPFFDVSAVRVTDDRKRARLTDNAVTCFFGGIRGAVFSSKHFLLTKQPFFFATADIDPFPKSSHFVENVRNADCTGVLLHYKFTSAFPALVARAVQEGQYWADSTEYQLYADVLKSEPNLAMNRKAKTITRFTGTGALIEAGFLESSPVYDSWVGRYGLGSEGDPRKERAL